MSRRAVDAALVLALAPLLAGFGVLEKRDPDVEAGNAALKSGKADDALAHYDKAVKALPADAGAHFDRGAALYALSRFDEAGQEFLRATEARDPALKESAFYNLGNAFFKKEKFKEAVAAYTRALGLRPDDKQAKWNLEIALRKAQQKEEKEKNKQDKNKQDKQSQNDKKDQKDQNKQDKQDHKDQRQKDQGQKDQKDQQAGKQDKQGDDKREKPKDQQAENDRDKSTEKSPEEIDAVLDNLERSSKDLEKERARIKAVRTAPPAKDW